MTTDKQLHSEWISSFLLGKLHMGIVLALEEQTAENIVEKIILVEKDIRDDIEKLYFPTHDQCTTA